MNCVHRFIRPTDRRTGKRPAVCCECGSKVKGIHFIVDSNQRFTPAFLKMEKRQCDAVKFLRENPKLWVGWEPNYLNCDHKWRVIAEELKRIGIYSTSTYWKDIRVDKLISRMRS